MDRAEERAGPEDVGDQTLMRGLVTALPFVHPGLSCLGSGIDYMIGHVETSGVPLAVVRRSVGPSRRPGGACSRIHSMARQARARLSTSELTNNLPFPVDLGPQSNGRGANMQKFYPRTNPAPQDAKENSNSKPVEAPLEMPRPESGVFDRERQNLSQIATQTDFNSLISRVSGVSLTPLQSVISDLQQLHDFLHAEGEKLRQDMSQYLHLSQSAMGSAKIIADNIAQWKEGTFGKQQSKAAETETLALPLPNVSSA
jgi:hypothetical protein